MDKDIKVALINRGLVGYVDNIHGHLVYVKLIDQNGKLTNDTICTKKKNLIRVGDNVIPFEKFESDRPFGIKNI